MHGRVPIDLGRGGLEYFRLYPLRNAKNINCSHYARLGRLDGVELIVYRRGRTGEIVDFIDLHVEREGDVVTHRLEVGVTMQAEWSFRMERYYEMPFCDSTGFELWCSIWRTSLQSMQQAWECLVSIAGVGWV